MATTEYKVAAAAFMTDPDDKGRFRTAVRGETIKLDRTDDKVKAAVERGHLIGVKDPLPEPSSPAKQKAAAAATSPAPITGDEDADAIAAKDAELAEANAKLLTAARLAPVLGGSVADVQKHLAAHPEDRDAIRFLEEHGTQKRKGVLEA